MSTIRRLHTHRRTIHTEDRHLGKTRGEAAGIKSRATAELDHVRPGSRPLAIRPKGVDHPVRVIAEKLVAEKNVEPRTAIEEAIVRRLRKRDAHRRARRNAARWLSRDFWRDDARWSLDGLAHAKEMRRVMCALIPEKCARQTLEVQELFTTLLLFLL